MQVFLLQPGWFFSKTWKPFLSSVITKKNRASDWPPVSGGGEKPRWEMPASEHSGPDGIATDQPSHQCFVTFNFPVSAWALHAAPSHCRSPLTVPSHLWQFRRSSAISPWGGKEFNQMRCLVREARRRATGHHYLFKVGRGKVYRHSCLCIQNLRKSHKKLVILP